MSEEAHKGETKEQERLQEKDVDSASANVKKKVKQSSKKRKGIKVSLEKNYEEVPSGM